MGLGVQSDMLINYLKKFLLFLKDLFDLGLLLFSQQNVSVPESDFVYF